MAILGRSTLKRYFETGKGLSNQAFNALIDSGLNRAATTAQSLGSDLIAGQVIATAGVSAGRVNAQTLLASAGTFTGLARHGVSAASATSTLGYLTVTQRATVNATATTQIALLPNSVNITGLTLDVLRASSGGAGGTQIQIGNGAVIDYFGAVTVSAPGVYRFSVSARRLQNTSGAVYAAGITA